MGKRSLSFWYCIDVERMVSGKKSITKCKYVSSRLRPLGDMGAEIAVSIWCRPATKKKKGTISTAACPRGRRVGQGRRVRIRASARFLEVVMQPNDAFMVEALHHFKLAVMIAPIKHHLRNVHVRQELVAEGYAGARGSGLLRQGAGQLTFLIATQSLQPSSRARHTTPNAPLPTTFSMR